MDTPKQSQEGPSGWVHPFSAERVDEYAPSAHEEAVAELNEYLERKSAQSRARQAAAIRASVERG